MSFLSSRTAKLIGLVSLVVLLPLAKAAMVRLLEFGFEHNYLLQEPPKSAATIAADLSPVIVVEISPQEAAQLKKGVEFTPRFERVEELVHDRLLICAAPFPLSGPRVILCSTDPQRNPERIAWPLMCRVEAMKRGSSLLAMTSASTNGIVQGAYHAPNESKGSAL